MPGYITGDSPNWREGRKTFRVARLLDLAPDWADFLGDGLTPEAYEAIRRSERTGRPLGAASFSARLEKRLGRSLKRQKPGPKSAADAD